ncbi:MAG: hypothetical protein Q7T97_00440 [Burkholderiaceae bacterium]|nr:hypothetical protein [Burkholderiaceae bacterium]
MSDLLAIVGSIVVAGLVAVAALPSLLRHFGFLRCDLRTEPVIQGAGFAFFCVLWFMFASSFLAWVFPIAFFVSYFLGYVLGGNTPAFNRSEIALSLICTGVATGASGLIAMSGPVDALGDVMARLMAMNYSVLVAAAVIRMAVRSFRASRKTASTDKSSP